MESLEAARLVLYGTIVGAIAGVLGSVITAWISNKAESKRQLLRLGFDSGMKELDTQLNVSKGKGRLYPPALFVQHHVKVMELIRDGEFTPEKYTAAMEELAALMKVAEDGQELFK